MPFKDKEKKKQYDKKYREKHKRVVSDKDKLRMKAYWAKSENRERQNHLRRKRYLRDKTLFAMANKAQRLKIRDYVIQQKAKPCIGCGGVFPHYVMHFHHKNPLKKEFTISKAKDSSVSIARIQNEIDKCDLLCANCHAIKTYEYYNKKTA